MAFKLASSEAFWYSVPVVQIDDNGKAREHHIPMKFKRLDIDERRERELRLGGDIYQQLLAESDGDTDSVSGKFTAELVRQGRMNRSAEELTDELLEIVSDWKEVEGPEGPMLFSRDNLCLLVRFLPNLPGAINDAYRTANSGELKRGNSSR